jgi:hypothetical protein
VTVFVCHIDGTPVGEFEEADFRERVFARRIAVNDYYWHEGMAEWRPVSHYRALAKTQKISFAPPVSPTIKINMDAPIPIGPPPKNFISRFLDRLRGKKRL